MMDDLDEDDDHRWSHGVTRETNRKGCRIEFWVNGWMDGLMDTFLPHAQAESVLKACSAFAFELN